MINTSRPINPPSKELCSYIVNKIGVSRNALDLGIKRSCLENSPLPIVMWSYGLVNLSQLNLIFSWQKDN